MVEIMKVGKGDDLTDVRLLFREYADELNEDLCFQNFDTELSDPLKKYGEPGGCILVAYDEGNAVGCIALQPLPDNNCEMKRLYVKPACRKLGVARLLVEKILQEAKDKNYKTMVLDTLERLQPAIKLYEHFEFEHMSAYYDNPLPNVVYMRKVL